MSCSARFEASEITYQSSPLYQDENQRGIREKETVRKSKQKEEESKKEEEKREEASTSNVKRCYTSFLLLQNPNSQGFSKFESSER